MEVRQALPEICWARLHMVENARNRRGNIRTITITATTLTYLVANIEGGNVYVILRADITGGEVLAGMLNITSQDKKIRLLLGNFLLDSSHTVL